MSKIVRAVNSMVSKPEKITDVVRKENEYYFLYDNKYVWSMVHSNEEKVHFLHFYPRKPSIEDLLGVTDWNRVDLVTYDTKTLGTREATESFSELRELLKERVLGADKALDDIIGDVDEF